MQATQYLYEADSFKRHSFWKRGICRRSSKFKELFQANRIIEPRPFAGKHEALLHKTTILSRYSADM